MFTRSATYENLTFFSRDARLWNESRVAEIEYRPFKLRGLLRLVDILSLLLREI